MNQRPLPGDRPGPTEKSTATEGSTATEIPFGYGDFGAWYDEYRADTLEPSLDAALTALTRELRDVLSDRDLARIRNIAGRVKSKRRTWRKLTQPRYRSMISAVEDIPHVIDDLVGLRITCTNLRDLAMVGAALDTLPHRARKGRPLGLDPSSERDYVETPKESGYRGWHVNLSLLHDGSPVICELQIRTLLQDSWGELTHEDTYSKAGELPPLVEILSKRMADLLATLDDIAEDLRNELDRIDEAVVAESDDADPDPGAPVSSADLPLSGLEADAANLLRERWVAVDRPVELATLAWALQSEFGAEVSDDWFGHHTFKRFLRHAVPDGEISTGRQAYLLPAAPRKPGPVSGSAGESLVDIAQVDDDQRDGDQRDGGTDGASGLPRAALELRRIDRAFPLIESDQWSRIYGQLAAAWLRIGGGPPSTKKLNELTRTARDRAGAAGEPLSRRHLDYVAKAVLATEAGNAPLTADQIAELFATMTLQRMADLRIVDTDDAAGRSTVGRWLLSGLE